MRARRRLLLGSFNSSGRTAYGKVLKHFKMALEQDSELFSPGGT
jgi:hypothetical protein